MASAERLQRNIRNLKTNQRRIFHSFGLIKEFVKNYQEERDHAEVPVRLESVVALWKEFGNVQSELEVIDETKDALEKYFVERTEFETAYYKVKGFLLEHCQSPIDVSIPAPPTLNHNSTHVKLPDVKLPIFDGIFEQWLNFHDLFVSLVHTSTELSSIEKFYYLRSSLAGEALELIKTIPLSGTNYTVAWNLLVEHFQNPRVLKRKYVQTLFEFPVLRRESADDLHSLVEKFEANVRVLKQLGERTDHWDILLVHCLASRLDPVTRRDWEDFSASNDALEFKHLTDFIQRRVSVLQQVFSKPVELQQASQSRRSTSPRFGTYGAFQENQKCVACSGDHLIHRCGTFARLPIGEKEDLVRKFKLCWNCLRRGHFVGKCLSESSCRNCGSRHHTQLCTTDDSSTGRSTQGAPSIQSRSSSPTIDSSNEQTSSTIPSTSGSMNPAQSHSGVSSCSSQGSTKVILATAVVIIVDGAGREHFARALLDSGSECCFASNKLVNKMKVKPFRVELPITGIGKSSTKASHMFHSVIKSRTSSYSTGVDFHILPEVTIDLPSINLDIAKWNIPKNVRLADPAFNESSAIDLVLGAELFYNLFPVAERIWLGDTLPTLINSVFGWIVSGKTVYKPPNHPVLCTTTSIDPYEPNEDCCRTPTSSPRSKINKIGSQDGRSRVPGGKSERFWTILLLVFCAVLGEFSHALENDLPTITTKVWMLWLSVGTLLAFVIGQWMGIRRGIEQNPTKKKRQTEKAN